jgi:uncharacterized protein
VSIFERFSLKNIPPVPWKNGGGTTREIACSPIGAGLGEFDWRVSVADVKIDGAFSIFENIDRIIVLLEGAGMQLVGVEGETVHSLTRLGHPFEFNGETPLSAKLVNGGSRDFNVMTRRGTHRAALESIENTCVRALQDHGILMVTRGQWTFQGESFGEGEGCVWRDAPVQSAQLLCDVNQRSQALFVSIQRTIVG